MKAPQSPADVALDALAAALAPKVAELVLERLRSGAANADPDVALDDVLASIGWEREAS